MTGYPVEIAAHVVDVELTEPLPAIPETDPTGRRATRAWVLVRVCTQPVGALLLDVPPDGLSPDALAAAIDDRLGPDRLGLRVGPIPAAGTDGGAGQVLLRRAEVLGTGPAITVVVCTRNRPAALARLLDSLTRQEYRRFRVLVVDNAPAGDDTAAVVRAASRALAASGALSVERIVAPVPGLSRARNAAVRAAPGETLAWIDDDEIADRYWLCEIARALLDHPEADVVSGAVVPAELETAAQLWFEEFGGHTKGRGFTPAVFSPATAARQSPLYPLPPFGAGANLTTRPGALARIGGFDPALGAGTPAMGGEDTLALTQVLRTGGTIVYQPSALTWHYHRRDLDGLRRQLVGYGTGLTAAYTSLVLRSPAVLPRLLALVPHAALDLFGSGGQRTATIGPTFPRELLRANRRGMLRGPGAYLRHRLRSGGGG